MKIVHVVDYFQPILGYQEVFLAKEQAKLGHDVFVITSDRYAPILYTNNAADSLLGSRIKQPGFFIEEGIKIWRLKTLFEFSSRVWMIGLEKKIKELKPDVINVDGVNTISAIRVALLKLRDKEMVKVKLVIDDHLNPEASKSFWRFLYPVLRKTTLKIVSNTADALIAVSNTTKEFMHQIYGIPLNKIIIIPLGADTSVFKPDKLAREMIRQELKIDKNDIVYIYTGKIVPFKYVDLLIKAAIRLIKKYSNIKILLVGYSDLSYKENLQRIIKDNNLENNFLWCEAVPNKELYKYFSAADIAVWPHQHTNSILEAMACGLPVIVCDEKRSCEEVKYDNGLIYKDLDLEDLQNKMEKLYIDKKLRIKMGENAIKIVKEKYNWHTITKEFLKVYEK